MPACCFECFCESGLTGRELQKLVDEQYPNFACEAEPCSPFSPGPVSNQEEVAFILIHPLHYDIESDTVVPQAFAELTNRDLSVLRVKYASRSEANATRSSLVERGKEKIPPNLRSVNEVCLASVADIRSVIESSSRVFGVYDTALGDIRSHASIFTRSDVLENRQLRKVVRNRIHEVLSKTRKSYDDFSASLSIA